MMLETPLKGWNNGGERLLELDHATLQRAFRKGIRNGEWFNLDSVKRALFRAAKEFLRIGRKIVKLDLLKDLLRMIKRLTSSVKRRIWQEGLEEAYSLRGRYEENGVFEWCPQAKDWLRDLDYVFYLGVRIVNSRLWGEERT